jgi:two-component system nitrogen regulation response regulator GlnG
MTGRIILADDDASLRLVLSQALSREGFGVRATGSLSALAKMVRDGEGDLVISDVYMGEECLFDVLPSIRAQRPSLPVIVMSGQSTVMTAVSASGAGAYDYLPKPFDLDVMIEAARRALVRGGEAKARAQSVAAQREERLPLIGRSTAMQAVYRIVSRAAATDMTVLIQGETGTGKEATARAIHQFSRRKDEPFVRLNLVGANQTAATDSLFGQNGATARASGGTLFVDDVDRLNDDAQALLENFIADLGRDGRPDVRIIASSSKPLSVMALEGAYRADLYYRLAIVTLTLPPLRERPEDIGDLARAFLVRARREGLPEKALDAGGIDLLKTYDWPGNVRELENLLRRVAALRPEGLITAKEIAGELAAVRTGVSRPAGSELSMEEAVRPFLAALVAAHAKGDGEANVYDRVLEAIERPLLEIALDATRGNQIRAAAILGINRNTLRKKLTSLGFRAAGDH